MPESDTIQGLFIRSREGRSMRLCSAFVPVMRGSDGGKNDMRRTLMRSVVNSGHQTFYAASRFS